MSLLANGMNFELIFAAWLHTQIEQLSADALRANIVVRMAFIDFYDAEYVIEHHGTTTHCSPEEAYAVLHFYLALDELEQRDRLHLPISHPL